MSPMMLPMTNETTFGPPKDVPVSFGASGPPRALQGGRGSSWRTGQLVLKPADTTDAILAWEARVLAGVPASSLRVGRPEPSIRGDFIVGGWSATRFCIGRHEPRRWLDIVAAGRRLHKALATVARPDFLASRAGPWAVADRAAWGEIGLTPFRDSP